MLREKTHDPWRVAEPFAYFAKAGTLQPSSKGVATIEPDQPP